MLLIQRPMIVGGPHDHEGMGFDQRYRSGFIEHEDLTRGAAIAYYTIFSIAPLLIIVIAIAGLVGHDAAEGSIVDQLSGLIGKQSAEIVESMIQSASHETAGNTRHDHRYRHVVADRDRRHIADA
jgi:hypothetical protein